MTNFREMPVYQDTMEEMLEKHNIEKLIQYERYCRDNFLFDQQKECFAAESRVRITWFDGDGREFVERSRTMAEGSGRSDDALYKGPKHKIYNTFVWLNNDKAVAEMQTMMFAYHDLDGTEYTRNGWARLLYKVQKIDGVWKIRGMDCIYERDLLFPVTPSYEFDTSADFSKYRKSYKCISYLFDQSGMDNNNRLPGDDRPLIVQELYEEATNWLMQDSLLPPVKQLKGAELQARMSRVSYLETHDAERYQGTEPVDVKKIYDELLADYEAAKTKYFEKRIILTGVVAKVGPDVWGVPSLELSDRADGRCYGLIVFPSEEIYDTVRVGDTVNILGNILNIREPYGIVVKKSVLQG